MGQRILRITGEFFVDLFGAGKRVYEVIEDPIPDDAKIVDAMINHPYAISTNVLTVFLESAEWPETPQGQPIPEVRPKAKVITEP